MRFAGSGGIAIVTPMPNDSFVHLHLHTEFSLLDGAVRVDQLVKKLVRLGMPAAAITDHGNLFGAIPFYRAAKKAGIKPIIGCEVYVAPGSMRDRTAASQKEAAYHLTLLAENDVGYRNLMRLVTGAHLDGFYYKPRIDHDFLAKHSQGLIGLSGCLKGEINSAILGGNETQARELAGMYAAIFGKGHFFIELHDHGMEVQARCNETLLRLAKDQGLGCVASNDVHFLEREHHEAHDVMICIGTQAMLEDQRRMRYLPELYCKSAEEMRKLFEHIPSACDNTLLIAERCNLELNFDTQNYPSFQAPAGKSNDDYLRELCEAGLHKRYGRRLLEDPTLKERLDFELAVLKKTGFVDYFLIVWDFIRFAKDRGIPVGPGRGSAAGSLAAYALEITDVDPIRFDLLFERFLNPDRVSPPDIDIDFCMNRRGEVIEYVRQKYGERSVAQIVTFGTLGAKSVVRDVGRVIGMSYSEADRLARMIPNELNITLTTTIDREGKEVPGAIDKNPELKAAIQSEPEARRLWDYAVTLEGLTRGTGIHAAGVVIAPGDLVEHVPLCRGKEDEIVTQYGMKALGDLGLLKMDFLGLRTLTVIQDTINLIRAHTPTFDLDAVGFEDEAAYQLLNRGETIGVFQLESKGMVNLCKRMGVASIDDLIALIALYRPGPLDLIPDFLARRKGESPIQYEHPLLEEVSANTYGILIYQEQVQMAASVLAGYTLAEADLLRRAMGKKDKDQMASERVRFREGCHRLNGIPAKKADAIFDLLEKFAGYGFNKSHSAAYGVLCFRTAYLKANYTVEFMSALLSSEVNDTEKITELVGECQRMGLRVLPPDVNASGLKFQPETAPGRVKAIRFGLEGIKNVGTKAVQAIVAEREKGGNYESLEDFARRVDSRDVSRKVLECLVKCGAFDSFGKERRVLFGGIEAAVTAASAHQRDLASGQRALFDAFDLPSSPRTTLEKVPEWSSRDLLRFEKELLGFYVTGHPLDEYRGALEGNGMTRISDLLDVHALHASEERSSNDRSDRNRRSVKIGGALMSVDKRFTKGESKPFAFLQVEDLTGVVEVCCWAETYGKYQKLLEVGSVVAIVGTLDARPENPKVIANEVILLKPKAGKKISCLTLRLDPDAPSFEDDLEELAKLLRNHSGALPVEIEVPRNGHLVVVAAGGTFSVAPSQQLIEDLKPWMAHA